LAEPVDVQFQSSFRIGRANDCGVCIKNRYVSRNHVEVAYESGQWWVRDLDSSNGVFVAGEMLDWDAPTGGYLLQASFATGVAAGQGALAWLQVPPI